MKKILMTVIVLGGLLTLGFRCLPLAQQKILISRSGNLLNQISPAAGHIFSTASAVEPKKYKLVAAEDAASPPADIIERNEHAQRTQLPVVASAYFQHLENVQVQGEGRVIKVLPDDNDGNKHQRFLVRTTEDVTVLIAHNISLAPRIKDLASGDQVSFVGEYVWNEKGGVVHWTHRDPRGSHQSGWIQRDGIIYR